MWATLTASTAKLGGRCTIFYRHLHVCIVGSGPAGFYTADKLLKLRKDANIDILERLPVPFGLVRSGVAPDHSETKVVTNQFSKIASDPRMSFFGNVHVGKDVTLKELKKLYDVVILAYGSESDNSLGIPGENLPGVLSAREFVWWYNGHPDCVDLPVDLQTSDTAVILGQGNVAIDIARILLRQVEELQTTDIAEHALSALRTSKIKKVYLVGRRGPAQIACTAKELRELLGLKGVSVIVQPSDLCISDLDKLELNESRIHKRVYELLCKAAGSRTVHSSEQDKELHFVFYRQPTEFLASEDRNWASGVRLEKTFLQKQSGSAWQQAVGTGTFENLESAVILKSIGYKSLPLDCLNFDNRKGSVPNLRGRVLQVPNADESTKTEPGLYVVGWLKRGPTGIIGTNLICAEEVTSSIIEDIASGILPSESTCEGRQGVMELLKTKGVVYVSFSEWQKINDFEITEGGKKGKPREKLVSVQEALHVAKFGEPNRCS